MFREEPNPRKKQPKIVAVINTAGCTGCEVCIDFCPVDCIDILPGPEHARLNKVCIINEDVCIGCSLCSKYCPWETIPMVPYGERHDDHAERKEQLELKLRPELAEAGEAEESADAEGAEVAAAS